jgi:nicotinate-nucleotide adenylyltransferase
MNAQPSANTGTEEASFPHKGGGASLLPKATPSRLGLFGGSFNPVHYGHLLAALTAKEELELSRVHFIPAAQSPFKPGTAIAPAADRAAMLRLALADCPWSQVDCQELGRGGVSYTVDTLRQYALDFPGAELFYLVGADHLQLLPKWKNAGELASLATFVVVGRPGEPPGSRGCPSAFRVQWLCGFQLGLSSSLTRQRVKEQRPIDWLVPLPVKEYIQRRKLYLSD